MMRTIKLIFALTKYFGIGWLLFRIKYILYKRTGYLEKQLHPFKWDEQPLVTWLKPEIPYESAEYVEWRKKYAGNLSIKYQHKPPVNPKWDVEQIFQQARMILSGKWTYFNDKTYNVGFPPQWNHDPITPYSWRADIHWSKVNDSAATDIKLVWEANRFSSAYILTRSYVYTSDDIYACGFWKLVEDWAEKNPPQMGVNWFCGQESSFRIMAWCFALYHMYESPETTNDRIVLLSTMVAAHGQRIENNLAYAISQNNNHGISECVGLMTIGLLFPEFKKSERWLKIGEKNLETLINSQIFDDGSYVQYSMNYHRVMLHDLLWIIMILKANNKSLSVDAMDRIKLAINFLDQMLDEQSGQVSNIGSNDGSLIFPLSNCDYNDYRSILQAAYGLVFQQRRFPSGPWDEEAFWFVGTTYQKLPSIVQGKDTTFSAPIGGYYRLSSQNSWLVMRCSDYEVRPHHADQLHVDVWWNGLNIARDAGTYSYNGLHPFNKNKLSRTSIHNTVMVDNKEQMTPFSRFLWLDWSKGTIDHFSDNYLEGKHNGYERLTNPVTHHRGIVKMDEKSWIVIDYLEAYHEHNYRWHWLLLDSPYEVGVDNNLVLNTLHGNYFISMLSPDVNMILDVHRASNNILGWESFTYNSKRPALSLTSEITHRNNTTVFTMFSAEELTIDSNTDIIQIFNESSSLEFTRTSQSANLCKSWNLKTNSKLKDSVSKFVEI